MLEEQQPNKNSSPKESSNSLFSIKKLSEQEASIHCCFNVFATELMMTQLLFSCLILPVLHRSK